MKETLRSAKYWLKKYSGQTFMIKTVFYSSTYTLINKNTLFGLFYIFYFVPGKTLE